MSRELLSQQEIRRLVDLLRDVFAHLAQLRSSEPLASMIQNPKVPPALSESLVAHLFQSGVLLGKRASVRRSRTGGDLELSKSDGGWARVEVKATAESAFQYFGPKDLAADLLVWVHFGDCFRDRQQNKFTALLLVNPRERIPEPRKITLPALVEAGGANLAALELDLDVVLTSTDKNEPTH